MWAIVSCFSQLSYGPFPTQCFRACACRFCLQYAVIHVVGPLVKINNKVLKKINGYKSNKTKVIEQHEIGEKFSILSERKEKAEFDFIERAENDRLFTGAVNYCLTREFLPAVFRPLAGSLLFNQPEELGLPRVPYVDSKLSLETQSA